MENWRRQRDKRKWKERRRGTKRMWARRRTEIEKRDVREIGGV